MAEQDPRGRSICDWELMAGKDGDVAYRYAVELVSSFNSVVSQDRALSGEESLGRIKLPEMKFACPIPKEGRKTTARTVIAIN